MRRILQLLRPPMNQVSPESDRRLVSRPSVLPAQRAQGWAVSQEAGLAAQLLPKRLRDGIQPQSSWVEPSMGTPGHLAALNALSSTAPDPVVIGEWIFKQLLGKRWPGLQGHLTCLSVKPGTCSSDTHRYFL